MKKIKIVLCAALAAAVVFSSCTSLQQDVVISSIPKEEIKEISNYEYRLAYIDARAIENSNPGPADLEEKLSSCEALIKDIDKLLKNSGLALAAQARLTALKGRAYLISDRPLKAKECVTLSDSQYKGDIQNYILSYRLGLTKTLTVETFSAQDKPLILLEQAIDFYKQKNYLSAVAKFDEAFISIESFYKDAFKTIRDDAWNLRALNDDSGDAVLLAKKELTIGQMMMITQNYPKLLEPYTGGNTFNEQALFRKLLSHGLLTPATKTQAPSKIYAYTPLTRSMQARFLWNIYCDRKNKPALRTKYSDAYKNLSGASPVKDVKKDDEDFDAILGCVEYELMDLTDGINFNPTGKVSGIEFKKAVEKIK